MDKDEFIKSKYARQLLADADKLKIELKEFNVSWQSFWKRNASDLGAILICHLAIEHYLDEWLTAANPATKPIGKDRIEPTKPKRHGLGDETLKVLQLFFDAGYDLSVERVAGTLSLQRNMVNYHFDILMEHRLIQQTTVGEGDSSNFGLTKNGRAFLMANQK